MSTPRQPSPPGQVSPDGRFRWDGQAWVPNDPRPVKKKHTVRNVLILLVVLVLAIGVGLAVVIGKTAKDAKDVVENSKIDGPSGPVDVEVGKAFRIDGYTFAAGWKVSADELGDLQVTDLRATNNGNVVSSASISISFLRDGKEVASADCLAQSIDVDESDDVACGSTDDLPTDYDSVRVEDLT